MYTSPLITEVPLFEDSCLCVSGNFPGSTNESVSEDVQETGNFIFGW